MQRLAACVLATLVFVLLGAPASSATNESLRYVALGDSYSAGSGVLPPDPEAQPQCLRSTSNYPHLVAAETGAELTDVTCGGADTSDYFTPQYDGVPAQLEALEADTELVTMTIGGNDSGVFINSIVQCGIAGAATLGQGSPCKDQYGSSFEDTIRTTTYPSLVNALEAVRAAAPDAKVAILSYPWILPTSGGCFDKMPVAEGDVPYLRSLQTTLNDAVRRAADATGATYVDMNAVSEGHDACQPIGVRWIEPVLQGTNPVVVHPNALGEQQMAAQTLAVLGLG
ncbi:SGNH/GDSL hydrolase family protein [Blastococcus sp. CT_GayMR16]|uniref:SGNH/GDSL hydrolase family protein n=1 Tax=Blastococcus sp. CT_GayMR16 TaxID=2559607 RepID=UPI0010733904|nr:SGNH/GDSL hydrolase family protein [Blastococcus sp. CT_GayMR16]TFV86980.1 SGNH/GDSL hydrolase family protein [Blastococcus sp. CT_GayMR16]